MSTEDRRKVPNMNLRRFARLATITTAAVLGLSGCGSQGDAAAPAEVNRQASGSIFGEKEFSVCISRTLKAGPLTVTFRNSIDSWGNGPFDLTSVQCGSSGRYLSLDVSDSTGERVLYIGGENPVIGYPSLKVRSTLDPTKWDENTFSVNQTHIYAAGGYLVKVTRQEDQETEFTPQKVLRVWVMAECPDLYYDYDYSCN